MIYLKLNQSVSYSEQWWLAAGGLTNVSQPGIYYKKFDVANMDTNKVVCSNWSNIYSDLLIASGMDSSKIVIQGKGKNMGTHNWVKVDLEDGKVLLADATNPFYGTTDLANVKLGSQTTGFIVTTEERFNEVWSSIQQQKSEGKINGGNTQVLTFEELARDSESKMIGEVLDQNTGYKDNIYLQEIQQSFSSATSIAADEKVTNFVQFVNKKGYSVLEAREFARKYAKGIFGEQTRVYTDREYGNFITEIIIPQDNGRIILRKRNDSDMEIIKCEGENQTEIIW